MEVQFDGCLKRVDELVAGAIFLAPNNATCIQSELGGEIYYVDLHLTTGRQPTLLSEDPHPKQIVLDQTETIALLHGEATLSQAEIDAGAARTAGNCVSHTDGEFYIVIKNNDGGIWFINIRNGKIKSELRDAGRSLLFKGFRILRKKLLIPD